MPSVGHFLLFSYDRKSLQSQSLFMICKLDICYNLEVTQWDFSSYIAHAVRFEAMEVRIYTWIQIALNQPTSIRSLCSSISWGFTFNVIIYAQYKFEFTLGLLLFWVFFFQISKFRIQITNFRKHLQTGDLYLLIVEFIEQLLFLELIHVLLRAL